MLQVRHIVRNGKGIFVYIALVRRCIPVHGFDLYQQPVRQAGSLRSNNSSRGREDADVGAVNKADSSEDGVSKSACRRATTAALESPKNSSSSRSASSSSSSSSSSSTRSSENVAEKDKKSVRQRLQELVSQFTTGTKVLWHDFKSSRKTKAKKQAGEALTFQEDRQLRQVGRDLAKALPVLTVFSLPLGGSLAPAIGFIFPKTLLPPQFWSSPQRLHFMLEDAMKQEVSSFPKLLQHLAMLASSPRPNSSPRQLRFSTGWFWKDGCLENLTREHLLRLVKACNTVPPFKKVTARFALRSWLVSWLSKEAASISNDDMALRKQFFSDASENETEQEEGPGLKLTGTEVLMLCWERGLLRSQHWPDAHLRWKEKGGGRAGGIAAAVADADKPIPEAEAQAMLSSLEDYLSLYDTPRATGNLRERYLDDATGADDSLLSSCGVGAALPPSMVLHAPALLRITHSASGSAPPLCHLRVEKTAR